MHLMLFNSILSSTVKSAFISKARKLFLAFSYNKKVIIVGRAIMTLKLFILMICGI